MWSGPLPDFLPLAVQMILALSMQIPSGHHGQGPIAIPATRWAYLPVEHAMVSILHFPWGKVWGHWELKFVEGHPPLLHQPGKSPPHSRAPGGGGPAVGDTLIPLLPLPSTRQNCLASCPQFPRSAGASGGLCPPWHPFLGYCHRMRGVASSMNTH